MMLAAAGTVDREAVDTPANTTDNLRGAVRPRGQKAKYRSRVSTGQPALNHENIPLHCLHSH